MNKHKDLPPAQPLKASVPLLGAQKWQCRNGHNYTAPQAWRYVLQVAPDQGLQSGPMCPVCFLNWATFANPAWPDGMTMEEAVGRGLLNPAVLGELQ